MKECNCDTRFDHSIVLDTRAVFLKRLQKEGRYRRRMCLECKKRFTTFEIDRREYDENFNNH
jgi:transcriptional regulator NrdR family protein